MSPAEREFDIVLYGATGFSGKLTAEHLAHSGSTARIALAGRSSERLRGVRMMLGPNAADWPLILADASQPLTLEAMAARAQVVLTTDRGAEPELGAQPDFLRRPGRDLAPELAGFWTGGFVQAPFNTRIVRRSNALQEWAYGRRFRYSETMSLGKSMAAPILAAAVTGTVAGTIGLGNKYFDRLPRRLVERVTPKPGTGPSRKTQERGHYTFETYTTTTTGARYRATFAHNVDAYKSTAVLLAQSGLALALDRDRLAELRGVLTPAAAMGDALLARLPGAGVVMGTTRLS